MKKLIVTLMAVQLAVFAHAQGLRLNQLEYFSKIILAQYLNKRSFQILC